MTFALRVIAVSLLMLVLAGANFVGSGCERARAIERAAAAIDASTLAHAGSSEIGWDDDIVAGDVVATSASFIDDSAANACSGLTALLDSSPTDDLDKELMTWPAVAAPVMVAGSTHQFIEPVLAPPREMTYTLLRPPQAAA